MRLAFLGTPGVAVPPLKEVARLGDVVAVITRPPAPRGRSNKPVPSEVARTAHAMDFAVQTPADRAGIVDSLRGAGQLDVAVVVAYGMIIPPEALALPRSGMVNLHFSLLPRWRGAAPVQRALMAGDERTGVSLMRLDAGLDTGPVYSTLSTRFGPDETAGEVLNRLAVRGATMLGELLAPLVAGDIVAARQPVEGVTHASRITRQDCRIDFTAPAPTIARQIRALGPRPGAFTTIEGEVFRVLRARVDDGELPPGRLVFEGSRLLCGTGCGIVDLLEVQPAGKRPMPGSDWARGRRSWPVDTG